MLLIPLKGAGGCRRRKIFNFGFSLALWFVYFCYIEGWKNIDPEKRVDLGHCTCHSVDFTSRF
jgi:hypothetical protein